MRRAPLRPGWGAVFAACVAVAGAASLWRGQDANWDLRNYHYYDAFALLHGRLGFDIAPAQLQTYLNPLADLYFYALIALAPGPRSVAFAMALPTAVAAYFLLRLLVLVFPLAAPHRMLSIVASAAIGLTAATGLAELGSTMNEWISAALVLPAVLLALRPLAQGSGPGWKAAAAAGLVMGCATGLKLTNGAFAVGLIAACLASGTWADGVRRAQAAAVGALAGFLATYGWWGALLQAELASPLFPYFNEFFRSPWWEAANWRNDKFGPRDAPQAIFFPLYFSRESALVSEISFRDYRLATLLVLGAAVALARLRPDPRARLDDPALRRAWAFLAAFAAASYLAWLAVFGIHRYLLPLELLSGALVVGSLVALVRHANARRVAIVLLAVLLVGTTRKPGWERVPFGEAYFEVAVPALDAEAMVLMGYDLPAAYLIPFFRRDARFVSPSNNFLAPGQDNLLARRAAAAIGGHRGALYLLARTPPAPETHAMLRHFGLGIVPEACAPVRSNLEAAPLQVCRLARPAT